MVRGGTIALGVGAGYACWPSPPAGSMARPRAATGSRRVNPDAIPATIWLFDAVPRLDAGEHRVLVAGRSVRPADLAGGGTVRARLDCTSGWYADDEWGGTRLSGLVPPERLAAGNSLVVRSVTGYTTVVSAADADSLWLAVTCQGRPLQPGNGSAVRLVARYGAGSGG